MSRRGGPTLQVQSALLNASDNAASIKDLSRFVGAIFRVCRSNSLSVEDFKSLTELGESLALRTSNVAAVIEDEASNAYASIDRVEVTHGQVKK